MQTYIDVWPLFSILACSIGMYLMGIRHGAKGLWARSSIGRFCNILKVRASWSTKRAWRRLRGKPVQVLPRIVVVRNGRPVTIKDRHYV